MKYRVKSPHPGPPDTNNYFAVDVVALCCFARLMSEAPVVAPLAYYRMHRARASRALDTGHLPCAFMPRNVSCRPTLASPSLLDS